MKTTILLALSACILSGCTLNGRKSFEALSKREGIHTINITSIYGTVKAQHINLETNQSATISPDGTVTVNQK